MILITATICIFYAAVERGHGTIPARTPAPDNGNCLVAGWLRGTNEVNLAGVVLQPERVFGDSNVAGVRIIDLKQLYILQTGQTWVIERGTFGRPSGRGFWPRMLNTDLNPSVNYMMGK
jgi:hypothetical protein